MIVQEKKQVIALKYFATGELTDEEYAKLVEGRAKGFSTFMSYYILTAIASRDEALAIELMKEYYGAMLDRGATSFWEDFNIDWLEQVKDTFGHGGGDYLMVQDFYKALTGETDSETTLARSVESHLMALAAERSRTSGEVCLVHRK